MSKSIHLILVAVLLTLSPLGQAQRADASHIFHVVQPGETLFTIGLKYGWLVTTLRAANGVTSDTLYVGQQLIIPDSNAHGASQASPPNTGETTYVVQPGDTLFKIGLKFNVSWTAIQAANGPAGTDIDAGQSLIIPNSIPSGLLLTAPVTLQPAVQNGRPVHVVQRGENLYRIGLNYDVTVDALVAANGLAGTTIVVGQTLTIPGEGVVASGPVSEPDTAADAPGNPETGIPGKHFVVDLSEQRVYAYEGETLLMTTLVSTGLPGTPTVTGLYSIYLKYDSQRLRGPGYDLPNVPYVMYFYQGYAIHGTYWHNDFGRPKSRGCVNLPTPQAEWAYNWAPIGTPVWVQP